jgi:hypothetical protein
MQLQTDLTCTHIYIICYDVIYLKQQVAHRCTSAMIWFNDSDDLMHLIK